MNERNRKLVTAAQTVFAKYGISKTTMNDIASSAGVARQTLYNAYPSKEAILRAAVRLSAEDTLQSVEDAWAKQTTLAEKLETYCQLGPLYWYDLLQMSPEAADLIDGINTIAHAETIEIEKLWKARFEQLIRDHVGDSGNASDMADFIYSASMNAKHSAPDRSVVETRLKLLTKGVVAMVA